MVGRHSVKTSPSRRCELVAVIASRADLELALSLSPPPGLFELRLDHLTGLEDQLEAQIAKLAAPLIITARHPAEGGAHNLSSARRRDLLARFSAHARYVDVELRSAEAFQSLLNSAPTSNLRRIISLHDFASTPSPRSLHAKARAAKSYGAAIFKVATRTDTPAQLARLFEFIGNEQVDLPVSVMGMGKLGEVGRVALAQCGSVLAYGSISTTTLEGQPSIEQLRAAFQILHIR